MSVTNLGWTAVFLAVLAWSGYQPASVGTWVLEVLPAVLAAIVLLLSRKKFPLTPLLYWLILAHCIILMVGGHYTYAEVPLGDWIRDWSGGSRNNYDKLGHFAQGFVPAMVARELSIRLGIFSSRGWMNLFIAGLCLGISAFYEFIEWWVALLSGDSADAFLGTQGYVWDTQSDMFMALLGALAALLSLARPHDRQLERLANAEVVAA